MNTDKVYGMPATDPVALREAMYGVLSRLQDQPEVQIQATAMCLFAMCRALGIDVRRLLVTVERMIEDLDGPHVYTFRSLEEYAKDMIGRSSHAVWID